MSDLSNIKRSVIKSLKDSGRSVDEIAEALDISRSTVYNVLNNKGGKRQRQRADRYEAFFKDSDSGCYHNGELLPSADQLRHGDPMEQLMLEEEITNRLIQGAKDGIESRD